MANAAAAESRADAEADGPASDSADDFEFCILSSGGIVPAGKGAAGADMCVADELFCQGKLLPLRPSSAADGASVATLPRSESAASTVGRVSRSGSRSASSSGSSSGCVSRSQSSKSDQGGGAAAPPPRRSLSGSVFYAHPSPSPQLRSARPRRSTGSAQPGAAWGLFRLGVVGAPDVYPPPRPAGDAKGAAAAASARGGGSRSARFEQVATAVDRKLGLGALFGDSLGCRCSPDVVEPVRTLEAAKRSRRTDGAKSGQGVGARRSRILDWLEELSVVKDKK